MDTTNWIEGARTEFTLSPIATKGEEGDPQGRRWVVYRHGVRVGFLTRARRFNGRRFGGVVWRVAWNPTGKPYEAIPMPRPVGGYLRRSDALGDLYGAACTGDPERWLYPAQHDAGAVSS